MTVCVRCVVTGRVQGVFFRASTRQKALALGVTGYARNQVNGSVEVLACGRPSALEQLQGWLWQGPPAASVEQVICSATDTVSLVTFTTG